MSLAADVGVIITQSDLLADMLNRCTEALVQHLGVAFARIWTLNPTENVLELRASAGMYTHLDGPHGRVPVGTFKIGLIAEERKPPPEQRRHRRPDASVTRNVPGARAWLPSRATPWSWTTG